MLLFYRECRAGAQIIFPESGRGLGHKTPTIFGIRSNISPKLLELETSNLVGGLLFGMPSRRTNNFPVIGRGLGHVTPTIFGSILGYPSDSLASCYLLYAMYDFAINILITSYIIKSILSLRTGDGTRIL